MFKVKKIFFFFSIIKWQNVVDPTENPESLLSLEDLTRDPIRSLESLIRSLESLEERLESLESTKLIRSL